MSPSLVGAPGPRPTHPGGRRADAGPRAPERGYIASSSSGRRRASLARYTRPPAAATLSSRASSRAGRPGGPTGKSSASVHPCWAKESGPGVPGPKRLSTARNEGIPEPAMVADRVFHHVTAIRGDGELILHETGRAVQEVPAPHPVERVEVGGQGDEGSRLGRRHPEPDLVEDAHRDPVGHADGRHERHPQPGLDRRFQPALRRAAGRSAAGAWSPRVSTDRGHHHGGRGSRARPRCNDGWCPPSPCRHEVFERRVLAAVDSDPGGLDRDQTEAGVQHDPGQPHASGGCPEQFGVGVGGELHGPGGGGQRQPLDVAAETAVAVVVLPMHVRGDGPAHRDVARARGHCDEPPRGMMAHELVQAHASPTLTVPVASSISPIPQSPAVSTTRPPLHSAASP